MANKSKKPSLSDLSVRFVQQEHLPDIFDELDNQSDRGAALIAAALVEDYLKKAMRSRMADFRNFDQIIFDNEGAPLGTFASRTKMARALNVIGPLAESHLVAIRKIRNQFAHSVLKIDFQNELIAKECDKLLPDDNPDWKPQFSPARRRYTGSIILMCKAFGALAAKERGNTIAAGLP